MDTSSKSIVITGSTSGLGLGLADAFASRGCTVTISGRSQAHLDQANATLSRKHAASLLHAHLADVSNYAQVEDLWNSAVSKFGRVDIWINNAGMAHPQTQISDFRPEDIQRVVSSNLVGVLHGLIVASKHMRQQEFGSIYNMEGLGSDGRAVSGLALYGSTKSAIAYLTKAAAREARGSTLMVGGLRPGMLVTKLISAQYSGHPDEWKRAERVLNILSDRVETVAPWMADKILANSKNGVTIRWLNKRKIMFRFLMSTFRRRKVFD